MGWNYHNKPYLGVPIDWAHPLAKGLVGCWLFNEGSGSKVLDLSGNENTGTLQGTAPSWSAGKFGPAVLLPGTDEYVLAGEKPDLSGGYYTILLKVNLDASQLNWAGLISKGDATASDWALQRYTSGNNLRIYHSAGAVDFVDGWSSIVGQGCIDVCITYDKVNARLFLNGILSDTKAFASLPTNTSGRVLKIGAERTGVSVAGQFEYVMIFNRALSASEILQTYLDPFCMFEREPIEVWAAGQAAGVTIPLFIHHYKQAGGL